MPRPLPHLHPFPTRRSSDLNQGHGTVAAGVIAGDRGAPIVHDLNDAIAPATKLVIQDAGFVLTGDTCAQLPGLRDRKGTRLNSSHGYISYAVFCSKKKKVTE